jgi:beta-glucosidase
MNEWEANDGGQRIMIYARRMYEDVFLEAAVDDDFVGVQTYTRARIDLPRVVGLAAGLGLSVPALERWLGPWAGKRQTLATREPAAGLPQTQVGWEFRPQAVGMTVRRAAALLPGKTIIVTEHGVATANDADRITFIRRGLVALHAVVSDRIPLKGYIHWSAFDNFEWSHGYSMNFGLIGVDRTTQERTIKPSARFLGDIARTSRVSVEP